MKSGRPPKLTPVFPMEVEPAREGVYSLLLPFNQLFSLWKGGYWRLTCRTPDRANEMTEPSVYAESMATGWRGLASEPKP